MNKRSYACCESKTIKKRDTASLASLLKLVAEESRLQILCILNNGTHCVCDLMEHTQLSQSLISHHLKDLKEAGVVSDEKRGQWVHYSLTPKGSQIVTKLFNLL